MKVVIFRGPSGCGKSTQARALMEAALEMDLTCATCSADDFFVTEGKYNFDPTKLSEAHGQCKAKFEGALSAKADLIIVDNTNTQKWEYQPYVDLAEASGYEVKLIVVGSPSDWENLNGRNVHGVPDHVVRKQIKRFEP